MQLSGRIYNSPNVVSLNQTTQTKFRFSQNTVLTSAMDNKQKIIMQESYREIQLCRTEQYRLVLVNITSIIYLKLITFNFNSTNHSQQMKIFKCTINLQNDPQLLRWFEGHSQLVQYLKDVNNLSIDIPHMRIKLLSQVMKGRSKYAEIGELKLRNYEISVVDQLRELLLLCQKGTDLSMNEIKKIITVLSQNVIEIQLERERVEQDIFADSADKKYGKSSQQNQQNQQNQQSQQNEQRNLVSQLQAKYDTELQNLSKRIVGINDEILKLTQNMVEITKYRNTNRQQTSSQTQSSTNQEIKTNQFEILNKEQFNKLLTNDVVDYRCKDFGKMFVRNNYMGVLNGKYYVNLFGKHKIKGKKCFSIQVGELENWMSVGIADRKCRDKSQLKSSDIHITYDSNHRLWDSNELIQKVGKGYKKGQTITVEIDFKQSTIRWKVDTQIRHEYQNKILNDERIQWVPYIFLPNSGDSIYWIS